MGTALLTRYADRFVSRQKNIERRFYPHFLKAVKDQYMAFISHARESKTALEHIDHIVTLGRMLTIIKKYYLACWYTESNYVLNKLIGIGYKSAYKLSLDEFAPVLNDYFDIYKFKNSAIQITETTKKDIVRYLTKAVDGGMTWDEALDAFQEIAVDTKYSRSSARARLIARTESTRGMNFGQLIGAYMSGKDVEKIWVTVHDNRVRPTPDFPTIYSHRKLEGQKVGLMKPYYNAEPIRYPGDPDAHEENTINCRCSQIFVEKKNRPTELRVLRNFMADFIAGIIATIISETILNDAS